LSESDGYKYLGKVNGRDSYILQRYCTNHCFLENCLHNDEVSLELNWLISPIDYIHLILNGGPSETVDIPHDSTGPQQLEDPETPIPSGKGYPSMVPGHQRRIEAARREYLVLKHQEEPVEAPEGQGEIEMSKTKPDLVQRQLSELSQLIVNVIEACNDNKEVLE